MKILGILLIIVGIFVGLFVAGYLCLYGGIVQIIHGITARPVNASAIAIGILRVLLTYLAGYISALIFIIPGIVLLKKS